MKPLVSVVIPTLHRPNLVVRAINSVLNQTQTSKTLRASQTRLTAGQASQLPPKPLGCEPISKKKYDVPQSGRAVPECPVE